MDLLQLAGLMSSIILIIFIYMIYVIGRTNEKQLEESRKQTRLLAEIAEKQGLLKIVIDAIKK